MIIFKKCKNCGKEVFASVDDKNRDDVMKRLLFSQAARAISDKCNSCGGLMGPAQKAD